jgi:hypothetical protein
MVKRASEYIADEVAYGVLFDRQNIDTFADWNASLDKIDSAVEIGSQPSTSGETNGYTKFQE